MILTYLRERRSWILLFVCLQLLFLVIAFLDAAIPFHSILYVVLISTIVFVFFVVFRYNKETSFYKKLVEWDQNLNGTGFAKPDSPYEHIVASTLTEQADMLKRTATTNRTLLEQEQDDLLSWIHEVKTPLTAMHLMMERLEDSGVKASLKYEWLRIHLLLDQQLHQKRMTFIENDVYMENIDLESLLFQEIKPLQSWCIQKGIGFDLQLNVSDIQTDVKWLAFSIRQIITNAVKYSESSDILIKSFREHEQVKLEIQDFGRGIDPRDLPRIFDKGFTSTTYHQDNASTGMGLYLTKKAADALHITIDVQSAVGEGTRFILTFPMKNDFVKIMST